MPKGTNLLSEFRCFRTKRPPLHQARQLASFVQNGNLPMGRFAPTAAGRENFQEILRLLRISGFFKQLYGWAS
jgi:hypothetical protein